VDHLKLAGDNKSTLFMLDRDLAQRAPEEGGE
jgi:ferritin